MGDRAFVRALASRSGIASPQAGPLLRPVRSLCCVASSLLASLKKHTLLSRVLHLRNDWSSKPCFFDTPCCQGRGYRASYLICRSLRFLHKLSEVIASVAQAGKAGAQESA